MTTDLPSQVVAILAESGIALPPSHVARDRLKEAFATDNQLVVQTQSFVGQADRLISGNYPAGFEARKHLEIRGRLLNIVLQIVDDPDYRYPPAIGGFRTVN
jgi:hypothetical protein